MNSLQGLAVPVQQLGFKKEATNQKQTTSFAKRPIEKKGEVPGTGRPETIHTSEPAKQGERRVLNSKEDRYDGTDSSPIGSVI